MRPILCPLCKAKPSTPFAWEWTSYEMATSRWSAAAALYKTSCRACGKPVSYVRYHHGGEASWNTWAEQMVPGQDCETMSTSTRVSVDGSRPVDVYWAWHPMGEEYSAQVASCIRHAIQDEAANHRLLVISYHQDPVYWLRELGSCIDRVLIIPQRCFAGCQGQYPSLYAELALIKTVGTMGMGSIGQVHCYWPALSLPRERYVPVMDDTTLAMAWSQYTRFNIQPKANQ